MSVKIEITLPESIHLRTVEGKSVALDVTRLPVGIIGAAFAVGCKTVMTNVWNGGGKDATDTDRMAALQKKMDAWYRGELNVTARGDSQMSAMREQYVDERKAATGATAASVDK